ncbi:MAG: hypothetical protein H8E71_04550 [Candidatus Marinimicrobia bacterium]|nr:hypothetical protein [Candidatus Neomarinimicrobiota bacterium]MBL7108730.1 hypothetical protein [Candidatus Neomarinimicrobiota bacterium]
MKKGLKYIVISMIFFAIGFSATAKTSSQTTAPEQFSVCLVFSSNAGVQFIDSGDHNSSNYGVLTDEVMKKRSHKRRRKVRPPKKGR